MVFADGDCVDGVGIVEAVVWLHGQLAAVAATVVVALEAEAKDPYVEILFGLKRGQARKKPT